jgi:glycosyltransferase involved in cell wall biosynthesis
MTASPGDRFHVLFLTFNLPGPDEPGAARPWEEMRCMCDLGWRVTVVTSSANYLTGEIVAPVRRLWRKRVAGDVSIIYIWAPTNYRGSLARRMICYLAYSLLAPLAALARGRVNAVFSATDPPFSTPGALLLSRIYRARLVLDERDLYPDAPLAVGFRPHPLLVAAFSSWANWLRGRAASVVTVSPGLKRVLIERGSPPEQTHVLANFFPRTDGYALSPPGAPEEDGTCRVVYAGGLGQANDVSTCLEAARLLRLQGHDHIRFVFVGAGERRQEYMAWALDHQLDGVEFPGPIPRRDLSRILYRSHIGISALPRAPYWQHALINKVFAYMEHGKPVVFAGQGDIADVLAEAGAGIVVPPEDPAAMAEALLRLSTCADERRALGERGKQYVQQRFRHEDICRQIDVAVRGQAS